MDACWGRLWSDSELVSRSIDTIIGSHGDQVPTLPGVPAPPPFLRELREEASLTQRQLGKRLKKPQSWVYNCETANRRVDVAEFILWARACGADPQTAFSRFLERL